MKNKKLFLLCGPAGSGKTTWIKKQIEMVNYPCLHISRDAIRFSLLSDGEDYFAHEDEVFKIFINKINDAISLKYENIYVDATHLNEKSRNKVLDLLNLDNVNIICVNFNISLKTCLERNAMREGRALVPDSAIRRMYYSFSPACYQEKHRYFNIINIEEYK